MVMLGVLLAATGSAAPLFLGGACADTEAEPQAVLAGQKKEFVLVLTAATAETPELGGDLFAVAGGLVVPLFKNQTFELHRVGEARAGVQRFKFVMSIPASEKKQTLLLCLRIRSGAADNWLPLPRVNLEAAPRTWKESLRLFARQVPSGRLAGSARLTGVFRQAEIETPEITGAEAAAEPSVRVWFAENAEEELRLPAHSPALWVVFRKNVRGGLEIRRIAPAAPLCVMVDESALTGLDTDAAAQELFERALATARTLTLSSTDYLPAQP